MLKIVKTRVYQLHDRVALILWYNDFISEKGFIAHQVYDPTMNKRIHLVWVCHLQVYHVYYKHLFLIEYSIQILWLETIVRPETSTENYQNCFITTHMLKMSCVSQIYKFEITTIISYWPSSSILSSLTMYDIPPTTKLGMH